MEKVQYHQHLDRIVSTDCGMVRGIAGSNPIFTVYKGVPYAKPPVGALRWCEPQASEPWDGIKECLEFNNRARQGLSNINSLYGKEFFQHEESQSEDCLYLNIWTPAKTSDEKLPVLFWVHGGAMVSGYGNEPEFDGEDFCREGVILVTINYRLGIFGFYANSELVKESSNHVAGNYGHQDQIAALKWVRRNIAAFGGDPDKVTIFGQSAGAASVQAMCASPLTQGDIAGCIIMSSASVSKPGKPGGMMPGASYEDTLRMGDEMMKEAGCKSLEELRKLTYEEILALPGLKADWANGIFPKYRFSSVVDGYTIKKQGSEMAYMGELPNIPFMVGNTKGEGQIFGKQQISDLNAWKARITGQYGEDFLQKFPVETTEEADALQGQLHGMMLNNRSFCECLLKNGKKAPYLYLFDRDLPGSNDGSFHSSELWYVFGTIGRCWRPMTGIDFDLSRTMSRAWANFAKNANPNGEGIPEWKPYTAENRCNMVFAAENACKPIAETPAMAYVVHKNID